MKPIRNLATDLEAGRTSARSLVETALERIADSSGEGERAFISVAADRARTEADRADADRAAGRPAPPFAGIPVAVKDLADIEGEVTTAGSVVLAGRPPAVADAPVVGRLRAVGFVVVGRTNMTEFAYSGLGLNAHYDTPRSPWSRDVGHIPGGSSSGTAVAVADGMVAAGLGTDTGGSCRIPAAFCGVVGFKPTASRIPLDGIVPLSFSLDSVGPLARTVDCCVIVDDVFAGGTGLGPGDVGTAPDSIRLAALSDLVTERLDDEVARRYRSALSVLSAAGVGVADVPFPELNELPHINRGGGLAAAEAYHWHRELLDADGDRYDQRVRTRIAPGSDLTAADYIDVVQARDRLQRAAVERLEGHSAFVLPTVAILPPEIGSFDDGDPTYYTDRNLLCLRNTSVGNFLDACAISIPIPPLDGPPVGLMLMAPGGADRELLALARSVEAALATMG